MVANAPAMAAILRAGVIRHACVDDSLALAQLIAEPTIALGGEPRDVAGIALHELGDAGIDTLVAEAQDGLQGFVQLRWGMRPPSLEWKHGSVELRRHCVRVRHRGTGVALRLLEAAVDLARQRQAPGVWLRIGKESPQQLQFYQQQGFRLAGTAFFGGEGHQREHWVMRRLLVDAHRQGMPRMRLAG